MRLSFKLFILICLLGVGERLIACECAYNLDSVTLSFHNADLVLKGKVLFSKVVEKKMDTILTVNRYGDTLYSVSIDPNAYRSYTVLVEDLYKGEIAKDTVEVKVSMHSFCSVSLDKEGDQLIFAHLDKNSYFTHYCSGNKVFNKGDHAILENLRTESSRSLDNQSN